MELKRFYKTQREVAEVINYLVDSYWADETNEEALVESVWKLHTDNPGKILKAFEFTTVLKQQCGKRRLEVIARILNLTSK
jgi:uncharacterized protein (TIGR04540 family)